MAGSGREVRQNHPKAVRRGAGDRADRFRQVDHALRGAPAARPATSNIITIEDPVEYQVAGISQIHVNPKIGLTFASGLRSIVRQDPDIIMVGEVRDRETAESRSTPP